MTGLIVLGFLSTIRLISVLFLRFLLIVLLRIHAE